MSQDLERRLANYYRETGHAIEKKYRMRPDLETQGMLYLLEDNQEGDLCYTYDIEDYNLFDEGEWHELPKSHISSDENLTKKDLEQAIEESFEDITASSDEILEEIYKGVSEANE